MLMTSFSFMTTWIIFSAAKIICIDVLIKKVRIIKCTYVFIDAISSSYTQHNAKKLFLQQLRGTKSQQSQKKEINKIKPQSKPESVDFAKVKIEKVWRFKKRYWIFYFYVSITWQRYSLRIRSCMRIVLNAPLWLFHGSYTLTAACSCTKLFTEFKSNSSPTPRAESAKR